MAEQPPKTSNESDRKSFLREYILLTEEDRKQMGNFFNEYINPFHRPENETEKKRREKTTKDMWGIPLGVVGSAAGGTAFAFKTLGKFVEYMINLDFGSGGIEKNRAFAESFSKGKKVWESGAH